MTGVTKRKWKEEDWKSLPSDSFMDSSRVYQSARKARKSASRRIRDDRRMREYNKDNKQYHSNKSSIEGVVPTTPSPNSTTKVNVDTRHTSISNDSNVSMACCNSSKPESEPVTSVSSDSTHSAKTVIHDNTVDDVFVPDKRLSQPAVSSPVSSSTSKEGNGTNKDIPVAQCSLKSCFQSTSTGALLSGYLKLAQTEENIHDKPDRYFDYNSSWSGTYSIEFDSLTNDT